MLTNRNLLLLLSGQLVSQIGDKFHMVALSLWVLHSTGSPAKMGVVLAASIIPSLVLGFFSGAVVDRYNRRNIIVITDLMRGLILAGFAVLFYFEMASFDVVLLMQIFLSVNAAFFDPSIPAIIPQIVEENELSAANSKHQFIKGVSTVCGAFIAGVLIPVFGYLWVFVINAASFLISAFFEYFIKISFVQRFYDGKSKIRMIFTDLKSGYTYILARNDLLILIFIVMVIHFFVGTIEVFLPVIADSISEDAAGNLGFLQASSGAGMVLTSAVLSFRNISGKEKIIMFGSVFIIGLLYVSAAYFTGDKIILLALYLAMIFIFGCCIICAYISFKTLMQKYIDNNFAGRVFAVVDSVGDGSIPAAMVIYGLLLGKFSLGVLLMISGLLLIPISIVSYVLYKEENYAP